MKSNQISVFKFVFVMVGMVISGQYFGWNYGLEKANISAYLVGVLILVVFYCFFMFACAYLVNQYADKEKSLPDLVGLAIGSKTGYIAGWACVFEYWLATPAIAISFALYLHHFIDIISYPIGVFIGFAIVLSANIGALNFVAKVETAATLIAIAGIVLFYYLAIKIIGLEQLSVKPFDMPINFNGIAYAIPFAIWLFLGIEGGLTLVHALRRPKLFGATGILIGLSILAGLAVFTVTLFTVITSDSLLLSDNPLPASIKALGFPVMGQALLLFGLFGLMASFNGLTIGYSQQLNMLGKSFNIKPLHHYRISRLICLILPLMIALICCLSNDLSMNFVVMSVVSALIVYFLVIISVLKLFYRQKKYLLFAVYFLVLIILCGIIGVTIYYTVLPANILLVGYRINITWILALGFVVVVLTSFKKSLLHS